MAFIPPAEAETIIIRPPTARKNAGITKPYRFHDLRATFCTAVPAANNNPMALKSAARHASLNTTMRYAKLSDDSVRQAFSATAGLIKLQTEVTNTSKKAPRRKPKAAAKNGENAGV